MTASGIEKIMTGYKGMLKYTDSMEDRKLGEKVMGRWVFGACHSAAKMLSYDDYAKLLNQMNYQHWMEKLKKFPDVRVIVLSKLFQINSRLAYLISRKV